MARAILISGPTGSGKGELMDYLIENFKNSFNFEYASCKQHLHELTMGLFDVDPETYWMIYEDRTQKEQPLPLFRIKVDGYSLCDLQWMVGGISEERDEQAREDRYIDLSVREAMIYTSEVIAKRLFGGDYFGKVRANRIDPFSDTVYIDDSASAFFEEGGKVEFSEVEPLKASIGSENILLVRVERPNNPYGGGDSRKRIPDQDDISTLDVVNEEGEIDAFLFDTAVEVGRWLFGEVK